jgi:SAM-dependent methyltransferase
LRRSFFNAIGTKKGDARVKKIIKAVLKLALKVVKKITPAPLKKRIKKYLTKHIGDVISNDNALHIAVNMVGGFGDVLILSAWVKELYRRLDCVVEIDVFRADKAVLFHLMPYKIRIFNNYLYHNAVGYDLKLEIEHFIKINHWVPYRILEKDKKLYDLLEKINVFNKEYEKYLTAQPYLDGEWANLMTKLGRNRWSELNIGGAFDFDNTKGLLHLDIVKYSVLEKLGVREKKYVTVHIGSDITWNKDKQQVKEWTINHYLKLCELIKQRYPDLLIVQLGANKSLSISNVDKNCLGKLSMAESIIILKYSLLHIDGESGLVHIRRQLHGKSIVLFGPTPIEYFKYNENININSPIQCTNCMWMVNEWHINCLVTGHGHPAKCMEAITPQMVMTEFTKYMDTVLAKEIKIFQTTLEIYSTAGLQNYDPVLTDICNTFGIEKLPVSEHIYFNDARFYIHASKQWEYPFVIDKIFAHTQQKEKKNVKIADVGGGAGLLAPYLTKLGYDTTVYDINYTWDPNGDPERTEKLRLRYAESVGLKMEYGSIFNIPAEDETFDIVTCVSVVEHVPYKIYAFKEMLRVLKPEGILIVTYDLVDSENKNNIDDARIEIFSPGLIQDTLSELGIKTIVNHTSADIQNSLDDMCRDKVNIPDGITVGGVCTEKEVFTPPPPHKNTEFTVGGFVLRKEVTM